MHEHLRNLILILRFYSFADCKQFLYLTQCYSIHSFLNIRQRGTIVSCYSLIQTFQNKLIFSLQNCPSNNKKTTTTKQKYNMYMFTAFAKYFAKAPFPLFTASSSFWVWCLPHHSRCLCTLFHSSFSLVSCFWKTSHGMTLPPPFGDGFGQMMRRSWLPSDMMFDIQAKHLSLCFIAPGSFSWSESPSCAFYWEVVSTLPLYHKGLIGGVQIVVFLEGSSLSTRKAGAQRHLQLLSGTWSSFTPISQTGWSALARVVVL